MATEHAKSTNMGGEIDIYFEYSPIESITLSLGEEVSFANFLTPQEGVFDATNTTFGITCTPHANIAMEAGYEFLYAHQNHMEHVVTLAAIPTVGFGDFELYLKETAQMTHAVGADECSTSWQWVSELNLSYAIPQTLLSPYVYIEMTNPLEPAPISWYDEFCYGIGLDWEVSKHNTLGIYYEFSHTPDALFHLIGIGYTLSI